MFFFRNLGLAILHPVSFRSRLRAGVRHLVLSWDLLATMLVVKPQACNSSWRTAASEQCSLGSSPHDIPG